MRSLTIAASLVFLFLFGGCVTSPADLRPTMDPGRGAIDGKLVASDQGPPDLSLLGSGGSLRIDLISAGGGTVASTLVRQDRPRFVFSNVPPGAYELSVYKLVLGKGRLAASQAATVDANQVTPVALVVQVTPEAAGQGDVNRD